MFTGHYGVSFAATVFTPRTSLGTLFLAVQFLDVANALIQPLEGECRSAVYEAEDSLTVGPLPENTR
jgi:hypothetical protein